jgi:hypothetical protein
MTGPMNRVPPEDDALAAQAQVMTSGRCPSCGGINIRTLVDPGTGAVRVICNEPGCGRTPAEVHSWGFRQ